jgi:predicted N-acetyltransferase YhbS
MPEPDLIELFVHPLNRLEFRYLVTGGVASMLYGEPRVTHDIALVVFLRPADIARLGEAYPDSDFYVPPAEVIAAELARERGGQFNIIHDASGLKADFYLPRRDEFQAWAFRNVRQYAIGGQLVRLAPPEYVIVSKLEFSRDGRSEKHLRDIRAMLSISGDLLDRPALEDWIRARRGERMTQGPRMITYRLGNDLDLDAVIELYRASTLGERRPVDDRARMAAMLAHANLVVSAWDGDRLVGLARSLSDFSYCTYLSDLAVRPSHQRQGIGRELIRRTQQAGGRAQIILLAAPKAVDYYPRVGFTHHPRAWVLPPEVPTR